MIGIQLPRRSNEEEPSPDLVPFRSPQAQARIRERRVMSGRSQPQIELEAKLGNQNTLPHPEQRWPVRWRFLFILTTAALCWLIPAAIVYLVLTRL